MSFRGDGGHVIAGSSLAAETIRKLAELARELAAQESAPLAHLRKSAGKLRFTQTAVMGRFGQAASSPIYELIADGGGRLSRELEDCLRWWELVLPTVTPSEDLLEPVRIYSDAAGSGKMASRVFLPRSIRELPVALKGTADEELSTLAASTSPIYIHELFEIAATICQMPGQLPGRRAILFVYNEAACAALTKDVAKNKSSFSSLRCLGYRRSTRHRALGGESADEREPGRSPTQRPRPTLRNGASQTASLPQGFPNHLRFFLDGLSASRESLL